jgi:hypothetical protein
MGHSQAVLSRVNRRKKVSMAGFSKTQLLLALHMSVQTSSIVFGDRIISSGIWPASSHKCKPFDFLFWGCLKDNVCNSNPQKEELEENSHREIENIPAEQLQRVNHNLFRQCEGCLRVEGQHFQHLL